MSDTNKLRERLSKGDNEAKPVAPMPSRSERQFACPVAESKGAIKANPEHPVAKVFKNAIRGYPDSKELIVDAVDMEALLDNKRVRAESTIEEGDEFSAVRVVRKKLVDPKEGTTSAGGSFQRPGNKTKEPAETQQPSGQGQPKTAGSDTK